MNESEVQPKKTRSHCPDSVLRESFREGGETKRKCFFDGGFSGPRGRAVSDYDDPTEESTLNKVGNGLGGLANIGLQAAMMYKMSNGPKAPAGKEIAPLGEKLDNKIGQIKNGTTARVAGAVDDNGFKSIHSSLNNQAPAIRQPVQLNNQAPAIRQPVQELSPEMRRKIDKLKKPAVNVQAPPNVQPPLKNNAAAIKTPQEQSRPGANIPNQQQKMVADKTNNTNIELSPIQENQENPSPYRKSSADDSRLQPYFDPNSPGINDNDSIISHYFARGDFAKGGSINPRIERLVTANEFVREDPRRDHEIEDQQEQIEKQKQQLQQMQHRY